MIKDTSVSSLESPTKKFIISNVQSCTLAGETPTVSVSDKDDLRHLVSFRKQVFMLLEKWNDKLNLVFKFKVDDFDYTVHVTTRTIPYFGCGAEGRLIHSFASCQSWQRSLSTRSIPEKEAWFTGGKQWWLQKLVCPHISEVQCKNVEVWLLNGGVAFLTFLDMWSPVATFVS